MSYEARMKRIALNSVFGKFSQQRVVRPYVRLYTLTKDPSHCYTYGPWRIEYNPKPIPPSCGVDWDYWHKDYDGPEDGRSGTGSGLRDCMDQIDEREDDED